MATKVVGYRRNISIKNWRSIATSFQRELLGENCLGKCRKGAIQILRDAQDAFVKSLPSEEAGYMPFITGNLHDSIVSVISDRGRVVAASYTEPVAKTPSLLTGKNVYSPTKAYGKRVVGAMAAFNWVKGMNGRFPTDIATTLNVTVPYAENPNRLSGRNRRGTHVGYLDVLAYKYAKFMDRGFVLFKASSDPKMFRWKNSAVTWNIPIGK